MRTFGFGSASMFCFAVQNYFIEKYLSTSSPYTNLNIMYVTVLCVMIPVSFFVRGTGFDPHPVLPTSLWWAAVLCGTLYAFADVFYFSAYTSGGSIFLITTLPILLPIFTSILKIVFDGHFPSWHYVGAWILGGGALTLLSLAPKTAAP